MADSRVETSVADRSDPAHDDIHLDGSTGDIGKFPNLKKHHHVREETADTLSSSYFENQNVNSVLNNAYDVGGVKCDEEDRSCLDFNKSGGDSSKFLPQLVFLDSEENISRIHDDVHFCENVGLHGQIRTERSVSDSAVANGHLPSDSNHSSSICDGYSNPLNHREKSKTSIQSNDSDLLCDHSVMVLESDNTNRLSTGGLLMRHSDEDPEAQDWHCHSANQSFPADKMARNQLIVVSVLCFLFMVGEAIGGALSNSLALFTDVLHLGSDLISFLISLLSMYLAKKSATRNMTFGYHRAEVLGALFSVFIIWSVTGVLVYVAIERIVHEHYKDVKPDEMLITAVLGVVFNIIMGFVLHSEMCCGGSRSVPSFGHGHSHGHSHGQSYNTTNENHRSQNIQRSPSHPPSARAGSGSRYQPLLSHDEDDDNLQMTDCVTEVETNNHAEKPHPKNINVRAAFIHVIGDIIQSLGVLLASIIIKIKPEEEYRLADPICTFLFSLLVLLTTINVLRDTLRIILEAVPRDTDYYSIKSSFQKIAGVKAVHGLTIWCLTLEKNALAVHLAVDVTADHKQVLHEASRMLKKEYSFLHSTIQVEDYKPAIMAKCTSCQELRK